MISFTHGANQSSNGEAMTQKEQDRHLIERLEQYAAIAHMAAAWGFAGEGMTMELAAKRLRELTQRDDA